MVKAASLRFFYANLASTTNSKSAFVNSNFVIANGQPVEVNLPCSFEESLVAPPDYAALFRCGLIKRDRAHGATESGHRRACRQFGVRRLRVFGSAARGDFQPEWSDLDFIAQFSWTGYAGYPCSSVIQIKPSAVPPENPATPSCHRRFSPTVRKSARDGSRAPDSARPVRG